VAEIAPQAWRNDKDIFFFSRQRRQPPTPFTPLYILRRDYAIDFVTFAERHFRFSPLSLFPFACRQPLYFQLSLDDG
jgi:hypothetical protein